MTWPGPKTRHSAAAAQPSSLGQAAAAQAFPPHDRGICPWMGLTADERRKMLEAIAADEDVKATQRLRALEELGRMDWRESAASSGKEEPTDEMAPDPMADLDELEQARQRRAAAG